MGAILKRNKLCPTQDDISAVYFNNVSEYYPVKTIHLIKFDAGAILTGLDTDILQACNINNNIDEILNFVSVLYSGPSEDMHALAMKHMRAFSEVLKRIEKRLKYIITISADADETSDFVLNKIIDTKQKNIVIAEVFEME